MAKHRSLSEIPSTQIDKRTERKVRGAMSQLVINNPFFSVLLLQQKMVYTTDLPTMATDGTAIFINPLFVKELTQVEVMGVFVHELYHTMLMHMTRRGNRDPKLFNMACDYAINPIVKHEGFVLPKDHLDDSKYHGMIADKIYRLLEKDEPDVPDDYIPDIVFNEGLSESEKTAQEQATKINITKAMTAAGDDVPDSIKKMIHEVIKSKVDWKLLLRDFIQVCLGQDEPTWKRPNRNYIHKGIYLPSYEGKTMPSIAVVIDVSGSIYCNTDLFETFAGEVNKIVADSMPEQVDIFYVDTRLQKHDTFEEGEMPTYELQGGGGSSFVSAWPKIEAVEPSCIIAFTDCWISFPEHSQIDTLWMCYENKEAHVPFGKLVYVEED